MSDIPLVYVVRAVDSLRVKIGRTTADRREYRLRELQTGSPEELRFEGFQQGGAALEKDLQHRWRARLLRDPGEWYAPDDEMEKWISEDVRGLGGLGTDPQLSLLDDPSSAQDVYPRWILDLHPDRRRDIERIVHTERTMAIGSLIVGEGAFDHDYGKAQHWLRWIDETLAAMYPNRFPPAADAPTLVAA